MLVIVNVVVGRSEVEIAAYEMTATESSAKTFASLKINLVPAQEPTHTQIHNTIERLRIPGGLPFAEDPEQQMQPLPEPSLQSTESRNVIDLTLQ